MASLPQAAGCDNMEAFQYGGHRGGMRDMDNTGRFSGRAGDYAIGRPAYAEALLQYLYSEQGLSPESVIADIGSGTGKFARQLLDRGSFLFCVEPNADMRSAAARELGGFERCRIVDGTAAASTLEGRSVDFVTAAQAFHWFDVGAFRRECRRILRPGGKVILLWNLRDLSAEVNRLSYDIFSRYCPAFQGFGGGIQRDDQRIRQFFRGGYTYVEFDHPLFYDRDRFISRSLSGSYSLKSGDARYEEYLAALSGLFDRCAAGRQLTMPNRTAAYIGGLD